MAASRSYGPVLHHARDRGTTKASRRRGANRLGRQVHSLSLVRTRRLRRLIGRREKLRSQSDPERGTAPHHSVLRR